MNVPTQYYRKNHVILDHELQVIFTGTVGAGDLARPSINAAKRESRRLQGSALGQGLLQLT